MLAYIKAVQHEVGPDLGDAFKEMVGGERALQAGGQANAMNQFAAGQSGRAPSPAHMPAP